MDEQPKQELVRKRYTFDGQACAVGGYRQEMASVLTPIGDYVVSWDVIRDAANSDGDIPKDAGIPWKRP